MKTAVITPAFYPDLRPIHFLADSCERQGIELIPHGVGVPFPGWTKGLVEYTIPEMDRLWKEGYSHVLYVDAIDTMLIACLPEIEWKYRNFGRPALIMSADSDIPRFNSDRFPTCAPEPWKYLNAGCFLGETGFLLELIDKMKKQYYQTDGDPQNWFTREWAINGAILDCSCTIFQSWDGNPSVQVIGSRVLNAVHGTYPCVLHFRGGYCDQISFRDDRIRPVATALYGETWSQPGERAAAFYLDR